MSDLDLPAREPNSTYAAIYKNMQVGDSHFIETEGKVIECKFYNNATTYGYRTGKKFAGRRVQGGIKVWRVK